MLKGKCVWAGALASIATILFIPSVYAATTGTTKFSVDVENTVLELTVPATPAVIDLNPTMTGASFGSTSINVKVATNNITGYQLTMTPTNSQTNTSLIRTELVGTEQTYREIETLDLTDPVSTGYPEEDFTANKWGYKITGDNYYGIDPNNTTVSHPAWVTNEPTNGVNHNLTLAAKADADTVSGAYETTLNFHAVTNAVPLVTLEMSYGFHGKQRVTVNNEEYYKMQDMTTEICSYTNEIPSQLEVVDIRDNTVYRIAKLLDGRCWLQDNLVLDLLDSTVQANISPDNTNASTTALNALFNGGRVSGDSTTNNLATAGIVDWTSGYSYSAPLINTAYKNTTNELDPIEIIKTSSKYGIYYNYCAASAGSYCYGNGTNAGTSYDKPDSLMDVEYDICPANWRMPTGATAGEYRFLYNSYLTSDRVFQAERFRIDFLAPLSGFYYNGSTYDQASNGRLWSSTRDVDTNMFLLLVQTSSADYFRSDDRKDGFPMRCIAK